jgi:hypothetical protein
VVTAQTRDLTLVNRCRCIDRHERGSQAWVRCPLTADGDHGYCLGCYPETARDQLLQAVIHGAPLAGISIDKAVAAFEGMTR